jgi:serine/threonine protein kinase
MLSEPPIYDENGKLDIDSVELRVVDFGIFGSIAGIRMENITCGSLKYMAPELLQGKTESSPKIDIWSIGLMLHAMVIGWLPFCKRDRNKLTQQILTEELTYKKLKRVRNNTIKDEYRRELNNRLRKLSDECIDLIELMLCKEPSNRIDLVDIFDHPFMRKH